MHYNKILVMLGSRLLGLGIVQFPLVVSEIGNLLSLQVIVISERNVISQKLNSHDRL